MVCYVERNAKKLICAEKRKIGSGLVCIEERRGLSIKKILSVWPVDVPKNYLLLVNKVQDKDDEELIEVDC